MGKIHALLVGIDDYPASVAPPLGGCANDVAEVHRLLTDLAGERADIRVLVNADATVAAVTDAIVRQLGAAGDEDLSLLWFSGHGTESIATGDDLLVEATGRNQAVVCVDGPLLDKRLGALLDSVAARGAQVTAVLDCCHSGGASREAAPTELTARYAPPSADWDLGRETGGNLGTAAVREIDLPGSASPHLLLAASRLDQPSFEGWFGGRRHGAFTHAFVGAVRAAGAAATGRELLAAAAARVQRSGSTQRPVLFPDLPGGPADRPFLGTAGSQAPPRTAHLLLRFGADGWEVDCGSAHGLRDGAGAQATRFTVVDSGPATTGSGPTSGSTPLTGNGPTTDSTPLTGSGPTTDSTPSTGNGPTTDSGPAIGTAPWTGNGPTTDNGPATGSGPTTDSTPSTGSGPTTDSGPAADSGPAIGTAPWTDTAPWTGNEPLTGDGPVVAARSVHPDRTLVDPVGWVPARDRVYPVALSALALPPGSVALDGPADAVRELAAAIGAAPLLRLADGPAGAADLHFRVRVRNGAAQVLRRDGTPFTEALPVGGEEAARRVAGCLAHLTRWHQLRELAPRPSLLDGLVRVEIAPWDAAPGEVLLPDASGEIVCRYLPGPGGSPQAPWVSIRLHNRSPDRTLWCLLLDLTDRYASHSTLYPGHFIGPGHTGHALDGDPVWLSLPAGHPAVPGAEARDWLKLIVAEGELNTLPFQLPPWDPHQDYVSRELGPALEGGPRRWTALTVPLRTLVP